jgi:hypothetical protein
MNRLVLIGNGFDLAHDLKTSYADFIDWYWNRRMLGFNNEHSDVSDDTLCRFKIRSNVREGRMTWNTYAFTHSYFNSNPALGVSYVGKDVIASILANTDHFEHKFYPLLERIITGLGSKNWEGIEQDYYDILKEYAFTDPKENPEPPIKYLNKQLRYLQELLVEYLTEVKKNDVQIIPSILNAIYAPINEKDVAIESRKHLQEHKEYWEFHEERDRELESIVEKYGLDVIQCSGEVEYWRKDQPGGTTVYPYAFLLPKKLMLLNFNYTNTASIYKRSYHSFADNHIHGNIDDPKRIIFGYGDELDDDFKVLKAHKNNACLSHIKSIKYLEAPNYREMLSFIEDEPFQVLIMGHSCGNSDRTLLNTIFEHPNCVSIKPYYYITDKKKGTDNYIELVQHISRNFNDMKLMRDRVVNKTQCEPLVHD